MKRRLAAGVISILLLAIPIGGCGSSSSARSGSSAEGRQSSGTSSSSSTPGGASAGPLSRRQFTARAEGICTRLNTQLASVQPKSNSRQEIERVVPAHVAAEQAAVSELARLAPPASLAGEWRQITDYRGSLASELAKLLIAAKANDSAAISRLTASKAQVHKKLLAAASRAGFKSCSQVG